MTIITHYIAFVIGMFVGRFFKDDEKCPRAVLGFTCKGNTCDHRKSVLYSNMHAMALQAEKRAAEREKNYWKDR